MPLVGLTEPPADGEALTVREWLVTHVLEIVNVPVFELEPLEL